MPAGGLWLFDRRILINWQIPKKFPTTFNHIFLYQANMKGKKKNPLEHSFSAVYMPYEQCY